MTYNLQHPLLSFESSPEMSGGVLLIVLFGAFLHASWNAIVKGSGDKFFGAASVTSAAGLIALFTLPFLSLPNPASWIYMLLSTITQTFYMSLVAAAYKSGDMSEAYPIMRGTPPLLVAMVSAPLVGEVMGWQSWLGIALICSGVLAMALDARRRNRGASSRTALLALANAGFIASYTIIDGLGVRVSGEPLSYTLWLFLMIAIPLAGWALYREPDRFIQYLRNHWRPAMIGGVGTLGSYGLALWAMTMAPIAVVAALRETAILFGVLISALVLKEKVGLPRFIAAGLIVLGAISLRLS